MMRITARRILTGTAGALAQPVAIVVLVTGAGLAATASPFKGTPIPPALGPAKPLAVVISVPGKPAYPQSIDLTAVRKPARAIEPTASAIHPVVDALPARSDKQDGPALASAGELPPPSPGPASFASPSPMAEPASADLVLPSDGPTGPGAKQHTPVPLVDPAEWAEVTRSGGSAALAASNFAADTGSPSPRYSGQAIRLDSGIDAAPPASRKVSFTVAVDVNGSPAGRLPLLIADADNISVRLADLLETVRPRMDAQLYDTLSSSRAADDYVTFNDLRAQGFSVRFDTDDRLLISLR